MSRFILPLESTFNINGLPQDGAKLEFFNVGLLTQKDTYSDEDLSIPNANPVVAGASGRFDDIWLNGDYDVTLSDKNDVLIWGPKTVRSTLSSAAGEITRNHKTVSAMINDPYLIVGDSVSVEDYATGNNSGTLFFTIVAAGTGTDDGGTYIDLTGSSLQAKQIFPNIRTPKMFGATGLGTGDDTAAVQNAFNAGGAVSLGDADNEYLVDTITLSNPVTMLSSGGSLKLRTTQTKLLIMNSSDVIIDGPVFDGNNYEVLQNLIIVYPELTNWKIINFTVKNIVGVTGQDQYGLKISTSGIEGEVREGTFKNISNYNPTQTPVSAFNGGIVVFSSGGGASRLVIDDIICDDIWTDNINGDIDNSDSDGIRVVSAEGTIESGLHIGEVTCTGVQKSGIKASGAKGIKYGELYVNATRTDVPMIAAARFQESDDSTVNSIKCKGNISRGVNIKSSNFDLGTLQYSPITLATGSHTGSDGASVLTDSSQSWTVDAFAGMTICNITDGSFATITSNTATTITATLLGGTDNDWDTDDDYTVETAIQSSLVSIQSTDADPTTNVTIQSATGTNLNRPVNFDTTGLTTDEGFVNITINALKGTYKKGANLNSNRIRRCRHVRINNVELFDPAGLLAEAWEFERFSDVKISGFYSEFRRNATVFTAGGTDIDPLDLENGMFVRPDSESSDAAYRSLNLRYSDGTALTGVKINNVTVSVPSYATTANQTIVKANLIGSNITDLIMIIRDVGVANPGTALQGTFFDCTIKGVDLIGAGKIGSVYAVNLDASSAKNSVCNVTSDELGVNLTNGASENLADAVAAYHANPINPSSPVNGNTNGTVHTFT